MPQDPHNSSDYKDLPPIPGGLIEALEARFPSRCPQVTDSERDIFLYAGKVALIQWLKTIQVQRLKASLIPLKVTNQNV